MLRGHTAMTEMENEEGREAGRESGKEEMIITETVDTAYRASDSFLQLPSFKQTS